MASYLQTFANYVLSFFIDAHQKALSDRLVEVLREVYQHLYTNANCRGKNTGPAKAKFLDEQDFCRAAKLSASFAYKGRGSALSAPNHPLL